MPVRFDADRRRTEIDSWDDYAQDQLNDAIARGEFDNLPGNGKPISIWMTDVNPEHDLAFSRLKQAGYRPVWMELDYAVAQERAALDARLDAADATIRQLVAQLQTTPTPAPAPPTSLLGRIRHWLALDLAIAPPARLTVTDVIARREQLRAEVLAQAAQLDQKIADYHNALPRGLAHLQRLRWTPQRAAAAFDERIPLRLIIGDE